MIERERQVPWRLIAGWAIVAVILALMIPTVVLVSELAQQVRGLSTNLDATRKQVENLGHTPVAPPAGDVRADPGVKPSAVPGPAGPAGASATQAQVAAAVNAYFEAHPVQPGRAPTGEEIARAVTTYIAAHPAAQGPIGPAPTAEQVAAAVLVYLTANPPPAGPTGPAGPKGDQGDPGPAPTAEQIAAAVQAWMTDHPPPYCPSGTSPTPATVVTTSGPVDAVICQSTSTPPPAGG